MWFEYSDKSSNLLARHDIWRNFQEKTFDWYLSRFLRTFLKGRRFIVDLMRPVSFLTYSSTSLPLLVIFLPKNLVIIAPVTFLRFPSVQMLKTSSAILLNFADFSKDASKKKTRQVSNEVYYKFDAPFVNIIVFF